MLRAARCSRLARACRASTTRAGALEDPSVDYYRVLHVPETASVEEIKASFRKHAKRLHPDAPGGGSRPAFLQLLAAYRVLASERHRQLYDLSRREGAPRAVRRAAAAASASAGAEADLERDVDLSWGLAAVLGRARTEGLCAGPSALDTLRAGLQDDFQLALRCAYAGPPLAGLSAGALPECFEGDERSSEGSPHLLRVVSGRQLLGFAVHRALAQLHGGEGEARQPLPAPADDPGAAALAPRGTAAAEGRESSCGAAGEQAQAQAQAGFPSSGSGQREPEVIELVLGGELVATAIRGARPPPAWWEGRASPPPPAAPALDAISFFSPDSRLLGLLHPPDVDGPAGRGPSAARLFNPAGTHTHTVLRTTSPLVRHLTFVAEPAAGVQAGLRPSRACICRARRAWLPPSSLWLFRPQSWEHDIGGWYFEWGGERQRGHPAWIHPSIFVLTAAFDSLDAERSRRQPRGLFGRLRSGEQQGGVASWIKSMLRFHGRGGK